MENEIVTGIALALRAEFGSDVAVYFGPVAQGLREPCFLILPLETGQMPYPSRRYRRTRSFDIHAFPAQRNDLRELQETADALCWALDKIALPDGTYLRGTGLYWEVVDGVLHFFVQYNSFIRCIDEFPAMENLAVKEDLDEGKKGRTHDKRTGLYQGAAGDIRAVPRAAGSAGGAAG